MYIDSHCHLNLDQFKNDYKSVINHAFEVGVEKIINVGADMDSSAKAIGLVKEYPGKLYATVGIHPHDSVGSFDEDKFFQLAQKKETVAIGEIGLDYSINTNKQSQIDLLDQQLRVAIKLSKPVVFHCRDAYDDLISHLLSLTQIPTGVIHCFVSDWQTAQVFLDLNFYLSFTGIITFTKNVNQLEAVKNTPLDRILVETDAPWLAPEPRRGKRNEPAYVSEVAKKIAEIKKIPIEQVAFATTENAKKLFKI